MKITRVTNADGVLVLLVMLLIIIRIGGYRRQLRVHQGRNVDPEEYPYVMVLVVKLKRVIPQRNTSHILTSRMCTCSLLKPAWALIAAHCLDYVQNKILPLSMLTVIYGDLTIPPNTTKYETGIQEVFVHPRYYINYLISSFQIRNDIALLLLTKPLNVKQLAELSAVDYRSLIGYPVTYVGGGGTFSLSSFMRNELIVIRETLKKDQTRPLQLGEAVVVKCDEGKVFGNVYPGICLVSKCSSPSQVIQGDSGGPLLFRGKIIGVASAGGPLAISLLSKFYKLDVGPVGDVYTAVSPYMDWIYSVVSRTN